MTHDEDVERVHKAMHAADCGCDGICGYGYRLMAMGAIDALDLPARDRRVKAQALREFADLVDSRYPTRDRLTAATVRSVANWARHEAEADQ